MSDTRKYAVSLGEPEAFDFDGTLRDRKLTPKAARAMLATLASAEPAIEARGKVDVVFGYSKTVMRRGVFVEVFIHDPATGTVEVRYRKITLHVHKDGATEKTMIHELAHACAPRFVEHGPQFGEWCLKLEALWLDILTRSEGSIKVPGAGVAPSYYSQAADTERG